LQIQPALISVAIIALISLDMRKRISLSHPAAVFIVMAVLPIIMLSEPMLTFFSVYPIPLADRLRESLGGCGAVAMILLFELYFAVRIHLPQDRIFGPVAGRADAAERERSKTMAGCGIFVLIYYGLYIFPYASLLFRFSALQRELLSDIVYLLVSEPLSFVYLSNHYFYYEFPLLYSFEYWPGLFQDYFSGNLLALLWHTVIWIYFFTIGTTMRMIHESERVRQYSGIYLVLAIAPVANLVCLLKLRAIAGAETETQHPKSVSVIGRPPGINRSRAYRVAVLVLLLTFEWLILLLCLMSMMNMLNIFYMNAAELLGEGIFVFLGLYIFIVHFAFNIFSIRKKRNLFVEMSAALAAWSGWWYIVWEFHKGELQGDVYCIFSKSCLVALLGLVMSEAVYRGVTFWNRAKKAGVCR
jgi:hypothetical protein